MHNHEGHGHLHAVGNKLKYAIMFSSLILVIELAGGLLSNSLALLSDAGHVFTDIVALSLSWYGVRQAERPASHRMTFGYHRVGVLVALVNALSILAIAAVILYEAFHRWQQPPEVNSQLMMGAAVVGLGVNIFVAHWLRREQRHNLNIRSAFWHAMGDALASVGVIIGGVIIMLTGWYIVDPIISVIISGIIVLAGWGIFREGLRVILEATPPHLDVHTMVEAMREMPGVKDVHDIHAWSISPGIDAMSCHVFIDDVLLSEASEIRQRLIDMLRQRFRIGHPVLQMECHDCGDNDIFCQLTVGP